jgi:hypothetical protein
MQLRSMSADPKLVSTPKLLATGDYTESYTMINSVNALVVCNLSLFAFLKKTHILEDVVQNIQVHFHHKTPYPYFKSFVQGSSRRQRVFLCIRRFVHRFRDIGTSLVRQRHRGIFQRWGNISYSLPHDVGRLGLRSDGFVSADYGTSMLLVSRVISKLWLTAVHQVLFVLWICCAAIILLNFIVGVLGEAYNQVSEKHQFM